MKRLPAGHGRPVIVYPGFLGNEKSTRALRGLLTELGYKPYDWEQGRNLRYSADIEQKMIEHLHGVFEKHGEKVSLVGWSLGGVYAREIAKAAPDKVRSVVTLGSPISGYCRASFLKPLFEYFNGKPSAEMKQRLSQISTPPPVPTTSIYSKSDGIIHWQDSVQAETSHTNNIRVYASHSGMGANPMVASAVANCLADPAGHKSGNYEAGFMDFLLSPPSFQTGDLANSS
ncbi:MAG: alpha/beta hydrolase [Hellea sp.]|nr:alpha/beta hydrolase [Hellea sp.]